MIDKKEFVKLRPELYSATQLEPFSKFYDRLKKELPNFPKDILEQWVYRHFSQFCNDYWWLEFDKFQFRKVEFENDKIMKIGSNIMEDLNYWGDDFINESNFRRDTWLGNYMIKNRTWPKPIIVFYSEESNLKIKKALCSPYHLLEGHLRLSYMRAFIKYEEDKIPNKHSVWIATKK